MALKLKNSYERIDYNIRTGQVEGEFWGKDGETGRGFNVYLWENGKLVYPRAEILRLNCMKPDGKRVWIEGKIEDDKFVIPLTSQVFTEEGNVKAEFELISLGKIVKSETFIIESKKSMKFGSVESSDVHRFEEERLRDLENKVEEIYGMLSHLVYLRIH